MNDDQFSWHLTYTGVSLDRAAELRPSSDQIEKMQFSDKARVLPVWNGMHFFEKDGVEPLWISSAEVESFLDQYTNPIFLGVGEDIPWFTLPLIGEAPPAFLASDGVFEVLHPRVGSIHAEQAALLSYARGMVLWHLNHLHCGRCGAITESHDAGHVRSCTNESCGHRMFPRTDPAVITLVVHPDGDKCLLGRQSRWPDGMYSVVAGFVEPGESLEECVKREVKEETGIETTDIRYIASQPWPFPSSLMLGFTAQALNAEFNPGDDELDDIRWVTRTELSTYGEMSDGTEGPKLPNSFSIARMLVERWRSSE